MDKVKCNCCGKFIDKAQAVRKKHNPIGGKRYGWSFYYYCIDCKGKNL